MRYTKRLETRRTFGLHMGPALSGQTAHALPAIFHKAYFFVNSSKAHLETEGHERNAIIVAIANNWLRFCYF